MGFLGVLFFFLFGLIVGLYAKDIEHTSRRTHNPVPSDARMDVLYDDPSEDFKTEAKKAGFVVKDARDEVHLYRHRVFYTNTQKQEYFDLLKKYHLERRSQDYISREYKKD